MGCRLETLRHWSFPLWAAHLWCLARDLLGDLGYELWIDPELALPFWDALYAAGADFGIQPYGESATNMARLERGFIMPIWNLTRRSKRSILSTIRRRLSWISDGWWILKTPLQR
ncbi:MAG: hypothetical protein CM15mP84_11160 [Cellvibrionales bacterium]|nr:MAG: hypothetical protein CM15mP84_11160 [Cellvibrionales bacterium]